MMKKVSEGHNPHVEFVQFGDLLSYLRTNNRMVGVAFKMWLGLC